MTATIDDLANEPTWGELAMDVAGATDASADDLPATGAPTATVATSEGM